MEGKPKLYLIFLSFLAVNRKIHSYKLSFDDTIYTVKRSKKPKKKYICPHEIPEEVFQYGKDNALISITLFDSSGEVLKTLHHLVYYSVNNVYIDHKNLEKGYNMEIDFKTSKDLKIKMHENIFEKFDTIGTPDRKKITLLNFDKSSIKINEHSIIFNSEIENCKFKSPVDFYRLSVNLEDPELKVIVQPIDKLKNPDIHLLKNKSQILQNFYNDIKTKLLVKEGNDYSKEYKRILKKYQKKLPNLNYEMNKSYKYLEEYFQKNPIDFDDISNYLAFSLFKDYREKYVKNKLLFSKIFKSLELFSVRIKHESDLKIFEKIALLLKISNIYSLCKKIEDLDYIDISYSIFSKCEENSILKKAKNMFDKFINNLDYDSKIFWYLLNLDSGVGYYKNEPVYTFDMSNISMIKNHLNELFPKVMLFYYYENDNLGSTNKNAGCVDFNVYKFLNEDHQEIIFDKKIDDEDFSNNMAVNVFIVLIHELGGHKKISYNKNINDDANSPKKIINESNKLIELKRYSSYINDDNEYILSSELSKEGNGESGSFLELSFGKYERDLITSLLILAESKGKLVDRAELFAQKNIDILRNYAPLIYKYNKIKKIGKFNAIKNLDIEEQIIKLKKIVDDPKYSELILKSEEEKEEKKFIGKKKKREESKIKVNKSEKIKHGISNYEKNKKKPKYGGINKNMKMNQLFGEKDIKNIEIEEDNEDDQTQEKENLSYSEPEDDESRLRRLKTKYREKYKYKNRGEMIVGVKELINEKMKSDEYDEELNDLSFLLRCLFWVY